MSSIGKSRFKTVTIWQFILLQGEYYNADEVQAMVAAEMLEEKRKKAEEEDMFDDIGAEAGQVMLIVVVRIAGNILENIRHDTTSKMNLGR